MPKACIGERQIVSRRVGGGVHRTRYREPAQCACRLANALASSDFFGYFLVASIAGVGMNTQLREVVAFSLEPAVLMAGDTVLLVAALAIVVLRWTP